MFTTKDQASLAEYIHSLGAVGIHVFNEFATRSVANKIVRPDDVVLDLGANEGFHAFHLSQIVGSNGIVHAFEPNPAHWPNLLSHDNIRLWPVAVGDRISVENFYLPVEQNFHQVGSLVDPSDFLGAVEMRTLSVPQVTIDSLEEINKDSISFIKMDIERREIFCMRGMLEVFNKSQPIVIFENNTPEIEDFLKNIQYSVHGMIPEAPVSTLPNVIAIPDSKKSDLPRLLLNKEEIDQILTTVDGMVQAS